jgi:hypothetical protein
MNGYPVVTRNIRIYDERTKAWVTVLVTMRVDWDRLAKLLGHKAYSNHTKQSKIHGGIITAEVPFPE